MGLIRQRSHSRFYRTKLSEETTLILMEYGFHTVEIKWWLCRIINGNIAYGIKMLIILPERWLAGAISNNLPYSIVMSKIM